MIYADDWGVMEQIAQNFEERFKSETRDLFYQRTLAVLLVGFILIPLFSILDYYVVRRFAELFFAYRAACASAFFVLMLVYFTNWGRKYPFAMGIAGYVIAGATISAMTFQMGWDSYYYVGILMVLVTFAALLPLNVKQSTVTGLLLYLIYALPMMLFIEHTPNDLRVFFNNSFFFVFFIVITIIQCYEDEKARRREFNLRVELDVLAERLSYYAQNLEIEVDKRAKQLEETEFRYRELYENIIDIVILVDRSSKILMANPRFYDTIGLKDGDKLDFSFMSFVHPVDVPIVQDNMIARLLKEQNVQDFQFRLVSRQGKIYMVECNAKSIKKGRALVGFQMVIRDVTERKKLEQDLLESYKSVQEARTATILGLAKLAEYRDEDTGSHLERIREFARIITVELARSPKYASYITREYIEDIYNSAILHDIGKVGVPDSILLKPARLSPDEFDVIKRHSMLGGDALRAVESQIDGTSFLTLGKEIAYYHHEKWDGSGYPVGLKGSEIPLSARIVAIADVYDALTSKRVYKDAFSHEKALEIIKNDSGTHFDPDVVEAFLMNAEDFRRVREEMHDLEQAKSA